ncbi:alpha/beta hydrolase family protein [Acidomonas methanolica]|uniref:alpha/beta hydrolase family protein n=1 Tax=Acidomonas methanolica TaxID=437 RepID=UPI00211A0A72|nr:alpha/beta hydrolase [Acidomonas methanolica]MCQ9154471.1 alpha/beta hydrolase [Acidomonas methanolica]
MTAGFRQITFPDPVQDATIETALFYPASGTAEALRFGAYPIAAALNAPVRGETLPLVVVSHGNGGFPQAHRDLALRLAEAGMVAALIRHPGNSTGDNGLANTLAIVEARPRHMNLVIDGLFADPALSPALAPERIALAGHSLGAYTALALAGGEPVTTRRETPDGPFRPFPVPHRAVRALVLLAPAPFWFPTPDRLTGVTAPIFLRTGQYDDITPDSASEVIRQGVSSPRPLDDAVAPGAGHFSFMSPFPPSRITPEIPASQDPPGFDRPAFLRGLHDEIAAFLTRIL